MKIKECSVGKRIISPIGKIWILVKRYSPDMWLIRRGHKTGMLCCLLRGQMKEWKICQSRKNCPKINKKKEE